MEQGMTDDGDRYIEYMPLGDLLGRRDPRNVKGHDVEFIDMLMTRFGYTAPVQLDERTGRLVAGHGRLAAVEARQARQGTLPRGVHEGDDGQWYVPVTRGWASADDDEAMAYLIADNRAPELGGWTDDLGPVLAELAASPAGLPPGFTSDDLDTILAELAGGDIPPDDTPDDVAPPGPVLIDWDKEPTTRRGDIWHLGPHIVMCGDCRNMDDVDMIMAGTRASIAFTSPPYARQRDYDESSGFTPIPEDEYVAWFEAVQAGVAEHLAPDGSWFVNIKPSSTGLDTSLYVFDLVIAHVREWGWHFATEFCWERHGVPKQVVRRFKNQFEPIYQFAQGDWKMRPDAVRHASDNVPVPGGEGVGDTSWKDDQGNRRPIFGGARRRPRGGTETASSAQGRNWAPGEYIAAGMAYPGNRLPTFSSTHEATGHTAAFPVGLPAWFIAAYTDPGDVVYDPFMGSGSTLLAAHQHGRVARGMELSRFYVDVICRRWQQHTGDSPVRGGEAVSFL